MNLEEALAVAPQEVRDAWWLYDHGLISLGDLRRRTLEAWPPSAPDLPGFDVQQKDVR